MSRLKVELHSHTADDPNDLVPYTFEDLIDRAASLGYQAIAITLHERRLDVEVEPLRSYAADRGIVLLPGVERTIEGRHVLLINFSAAAQAVRSFTDLEALKRREKGLVVAPHLFYPGSKGLGSLADRHAALIDAVEVHGFHPVGIDIFNNQARRWAAKFGKPLVGNGDVHRLSQLGSTYSMVDADPEPDSICDAIRAGRVEVHSTPLGWFRLISLLVSIFVADWRSGDHRSKNARWASARRRR
jgi:predicted metal-dependent phosphoesterase TrpH